MNYFYNNLKFFGVFCNFLKRVASYCIQIEKQTIENPNFKTLWIYLVFSFYGLNIRMYIRKLLVKIGNQYFKVKKFMIDARFKPVDRHEIVKDKSVEELNAQLVSLLGENEAEMLISAFRSRRSISGHELTG